MSFVAWLNEANPEVISTEYNIFSKEEGYAGTVDMKLRIAGEIWSVDIKTGQYVWPEYELQVSAYRRADADVERTGILQVGFQRNKSKFKFTEIEDRYDLFLFREKHLVPRNRRAETLSKRLSALPAMGTQRRKQQNKLINHKTMPWGTEIETGGVWKPTRTGEKLEGIFKGRKTLLGRNDKDYTLFTIETEDGEMKVSGAVLESKFKRDQPRRWKPAFPDGTGILLTYKGKPKGTYLDYAIQAWEEEAKPTL